MTEYSKTKPEVPKGPLPAEEQFYRLQGVPTKAKDSQEYQQALRAGAEPIGKHEAEAGQQARNDIANTSGLESAGLGLASGLTLGIGPGLAVEGGLLSPNKVGAAQSSGLYTAGDVAGMAAPMLLSGGGAAEARGIGGSILRASPAALMGDLGEGAGKFAASFLGDNLGVMGKALKPAVDMAARGATEGALINVGHTIGNNLVYDQPFSMEALAASGADGALFGGLLGGGMGAVGGMAGLAIDGTKSLIGKTAGRGERGLASIAKRAGYGVDEVESAAAGTGLKSEIGGMGELFEASGEKVNLGSANEDIQKAFAKGGANKQLVVEHGLETLQKEAASSVPTTARIFDRLDKEVLGPNLGTMAETDIASALKSVKERLSSIDSAPVAKAPDIETPAKGWNKFSKNSAAKAALEAAGDGSIDVEFGPTGTWGKWAKSIEQLEKANIPGSIKSDVLNIVKNEFSSAMKGAAEAIGRPGLAEQISSAQALVDLSKKLEGTMGKKAAQDLLHTEAHITPKDALTAGAIAATGHPGSALGYMGLKGLGRIVGSRLEPAFAQMAYEANFGAKAATATANVKTRIGESMKTFFRKVPEAATAGGSATKKDLKAATNKPGYDRKSYEDAVASAEQLMSPNHQQRVQQYANQLAQMGYMQMANTMVKMNGDLVGYLQHNMPASKSGGMSLRKQPVPSGLDVKEFKFLRQLKVGKNPLSVLDDLESGSLGQDQVKMLKYFAPEIHANIVQAASEEIVNMKQEGRDLPIDKVCQLGIMLDTAIDPMLEPDYIAAVQASFAPPAPPEGGQQQAPAPDQSGMTATNLMTVEQKSLYT